MTGTTRFGFELRWADQPPAGSDEQRTNGGLVLWLDSAHPWNSLEPNARPKPLEWTWLDLLEWLGDSWPALLHDEGYPADSPLLPHQPASLVDAIRRVEGDEPSQDQLDWWAQHNLAGAPNGLGLADVVLLRLGQTMVIGCAETNARVVLPAGQVLDVLRQVGDELAARLNGCEERRGVRALRRWQDRATRSAAQFLRFQGLPADDLAELAAGADLAEFLGYDPHSPQATSLQMAARSLRQVVPVSVVRMVTDQIRQAPAMLTPELDTLSREASEVVVEVLDKHPAQQGYHAARWLRLRLCRKRERLEPADLLGRWKVLVVELELPSSRVEAVSFWGHQHGPGVIINPTGRFSQTMPGRRATIAHEICHLLLDRDTELPVGQVNGLARRYGHEQRANAFAAELLLPGSVAALASLEAELETQVTALTDQYGVGRELILWRMYNHGQLPASAHLRQLLDEIAPHQATL
ncbi:MAG: ImmA/IrrE family metallo-endopeptidase [Fimbriimonadaceae bacterium]|nr:ImmA/IrrE family metallo-endopeptidase [Fimbriimonadaceae bacterium]